MRDQETEIDRFEAVDDEGRSYTVVEWQRITFRRTINGELVKIRGMKRLALDTGEHVNPGEGGTFKLFETGTILRKVG